MAKTRSPSGRFPMEIQRHSPSVVVSKFATLRYRPPSELQNQNDTRNQYVASVLSIPKFAKRRYRDVANFGIGTLAQIGRALTPHASTMPSEVGFGCLRYLDGSAKI